MFIMDFECGGRAIKFLGTKRHHDKWLKDTKNYVVKGCFAMTELGHGSNVKGIETVATYDSNTGEFVINTPCESAKILYWWSSQWVHAFICQIKDADGKIRPNIRIADCGHKIGFDNVRIPKENLLNSIADVSPDGEYLSAIKDPDQRFAAFMAALTLGHECHEACGGQGLKTENHVGHLKGEIDVQSPFEGDNNVLMQQVNVYGLLSYKL
ncbi:hypothetical protein Pint_11258 [Pistacia integerrima]|uniref:Uncharacterized protein n=1 Tax=Pistacia integerrima TaxID=434235 RepID=A0ACC0XNC0_9ROSI|nr:hypothetical protein Pint_11258 [Pistacia integerrima]